LEEYVLQDLARLTRGVVDGVNAGSIQYHAEFLGDVNVSMQEIERRVREINGQAIPHFNEQFEVVNRRSFNREKAMLAPGDPSFTMTAAKTSFVQQAAATVGAQFVSLTGSLGMGGMQLQQFYTQTLNFAFAQASSGVFSYDQAIRLAAQRLRGKGLQTIHWASGRKESVESAVRRSVLTGLKQATNAVSDLNANELGCDGWEITAHMGARPTHKEWQGKQFARYKGRTQGFSLFDEVVGDQMQEPNCRHTKFGIFLGQSPVWSPEDLAGIDPPDFEFMGKEYTAYTASQRQRELERRIRQSKRDVVIAEGMGDEEMTLTQRSRLVQQQRQYREFSQAAGLPRQPERLWAA